MSESVKTLEELHARDGIKVLSFDLDDTIWACKPVLSRAERAQLSFIREFNPELERYIERKAWKELYDRAMKGHEHMAYDFTFSRKKTLFLAAQEANLEDPGKVSEDIFHAFSTARNNVLDHVYPGVIPALKQLKERFTLVSLTNGNAFAERIPGLRHLFDHSVNAGQAGAQKPDRKPFERVMELTGVAAEEIVHVGDSLSSDVRGARAVGMHTVWVSHGRRVEEAEREATLVVSCASELQVECGDE